MTVGDEPRVVCPRCDREVAYRLGFCSSCGETLPADPATTGADEPLAPGQELDECEVLGGARPRPLGSAYPVRDLRTGQEAELRILRAPVDLPPSRWQQFQAVLAGAAQWRGSAGLRDVLRHRTVADVVRVVLDGVPGQLLAAHLVGPTGAPRALDRPGARALLAQLCAALERLHEHTAHGGLWPGALLVRWRGEVLDHLALDLPGEIWLQPAPRAWAAHCVGSAAYVAPEVLAGGPPETPADIYAVGVLTYEVLTGRLPRGLAAPPSELIPQLGVGLDPVLARALAERPGDRYARIGDLQRELLAALDVTSAAAPGAPAADVSGPLSAPPEVVPGPPTSVATGATLAAGRPRRRWPTVALVLLLVAAGVALYWQRALLFGPPAPPPGRATLVVRAQPDGALVNLDGVDHGGVPVQLVGVAPNATHYLRLTAPGHQLRVVEVRLAPGERREIMVRLLPEPR